MSEGERNIYKGRTNSKQKQTHALQKAEGVTRKQKKFKQNLVSTSGTMDNNECSGDTQSYNKIASGLYIGDKNAAQDLDLISKLKLTHVLTAELIPLPRIVTSTYPNLAILHLPIADLEDTDLLTNLEATSKFIRDGLDMRGAVLVHCYHGVSRSASIVIAYLMQRKELTYEQGLKLVTKRRPCVCPNEGFKMQLKLLAKMSWKIDPNLPDFKYYKLTLIKNQFCKTDILPPEAKYTLHDQVAHDETSAAKSLRSKGSLFRCKKCRITLFNQSNVLPHFQGLSANWQEMVEQDHDSEGQIFCQNGIFIEPLMWMSKICRNSKFGRLTCFKCQNKLGSFNWSNHVMCPCGAKFCPAFLINCNRVDLCTMLKDVEADL